MSVKTQDTILSASWKLQLISSLFMGGLFGIYHYLLSDGQLSIFLYYTTFSFILSMGLWQSAKLVFFLTDKKYSWFENPYKRVIISLIFGFIGTYIVVYLVDYILPYILDPLFDIKITNLSEQPQMNLAVFFLDGTISLFIFLLYLSLINLFQYFNELQDKRIRLAEKNIEKYFSTLIENIHDVIQVVDSEGMKIYCSPSIENLTGYTAAEALNLKTGFELVHPDDREFISEELKWQISQNFITYTTQCRTITKQGEVKTVESKFINASKNPLLNGYIVVMSDVTNRVKNEAEINKQREIYQILTEISTEFLNREFTDAIGLMLEKIGRYVNVDRAYLYTFENKEEIWQCKHQWLGPGAQNLSKKYVSTDILTTQSEWFFNQMKMNLVLNYGDINDLPSIGSDFKQICENNSSKSILIFPLNKNGEIYGYIGFDSVLEKKFWHQIDVSAIQICSEMTISALLRDTAEKKVQRSFSVNKAILDSNSEGILLIDLNGNIIYHNDNFKEMWMLDDLDLIDKSYTSTLLKIKEKLVNKEEFIQGIGDSDEKSKNEIRIVAHLVNKRILEGISLPQIIEGNVVGRVWSYRDITERVNAEKEEMEKSFAQAQFESLKNQVNPHFLFNSLNVLSSLVHIDPELSEKFIDQLAKSYRYLLEQRDNELVMLKTEIDFVHSFTFLLKIRFEEKLKVNIDLSADVMNLYIAPLTLQLLIENAVKHNVISSENPLIIDIYNEKTDCLIVRNNLQVRNQQLPSTGVGIHNIKERYRMLSNEKTEFYIKENKYFARIPIIKK